jgi:hypothetical protein
MDLAQSAAEEARLPEEGEDLFEHFILELGHDRPFAAAAQHDPDGLARPDFGAGPGVLAEDPAAFHRVAELRALLSENEIFLGQGGPGFGRGPAFQVGHGDRFPLENDPRDDDGAEEENGGEAEDEKQSLGEYVIRHGSSRSGARTSYYYHS